LRANAYILFRKSLFTAYKLCKFVRSSPKFLLEPSYYQSHIQVVCLIDIILVKSDPIMNDSSIRAEQIIRSLCKKYSILALGWNREGTPNELHHDENGLQLFNFRAPYGYEPYGTLRLLPRLPIFWVWVFIKLCLHRPKSMHACNFGAILPCYLYKVLFRKKLIFDVFDRYAMVSILKNRNVFFKKLYSLINSLEETFAKNSDVLIVNSDKMLLTFRKKPRNCITIMNCSKDHMINRSRVETNGFKLFFPGHLKLGRGLEILPDIVMDLKDTELMIAGRIEDKKLLNNINGIPNVKYHGLLDQNRLLDLEASSDVMIALYDLNLQTQHKYGMANKILEAMMCGLPIITNIAHEIVNETGCGIIVEYGNVEQIKEAIITLRDDPELRKRLGDNGRKAFLEKYNWTNMEEKLYEIYEDLLDK
jgi:glycosyltransferase involved in cell wall biosynthesis